MIYIKCTVAYKIFTGFCKISFVIYRKLRFNQKFLMHVRKIVTQITMGVILIRINPFLDRGWIRPQEPSECINVFGKIVSGKALIA